jgi:NADPH-dependent 2,4-dienoyl-CoA reductase/sulfur reductase-like enzyme
MTAVAIIGAGPYGISIAAYLRHAGVEPHVFGETMESWRRNMPEGMKLRSRIRSSHIANPGGELGIDAWEAETGTPRAEPMPIERFISYGCWYQQKAVPAVDRRRVRSLSLADGGFALSLDDGEEVAAERVVVAGGITPFAYSPPLFQGLPEDLVSHSSVHSDLGKFAGRDVLVVGGGQSALETTALLNEGGAKPQLVARAADLVWLRPPRASEPMLPPTDVGGRVSGWLAATPGALRRGPVSTRRWVTARCTVPAGADWLVSRLERVPLQVGREVTSLEPVGDGVEVGFGDGESSRFDHIVVCTGYRVDLRRYDFLAPELLDRLELANGAPRLGRGLESSLPGLHVGGAAATSSFGPIMRFVVGTWYAAPAVAQAISGARQRPAHFAYRPRVGPHRTRRR